MKKTLVLLAVLFTGIFMVACQSDAPSQEFTLETLSAYDGQNGAKAYVAIDGIVYDVTNEDDWDNGYHKGLLLAGTDATSVFASSPHGASLLKDLKKVGILVDNLSQTNSTTNSTLKVFTLAELATYTGTNNTTAYIAVDGIVYDVTAVFNNGTHQGMQLGGTDATTVFASSPHSASLLASLPKVGSLEGYPLVTTTTPTTNPGSYDDDDEVMASLLPEAILTYISQNYPNATIHEADFEDGGYEVELSNDLELYFDTNGLFLYSEYDD